MKESILDTIGSTPLVHLKRLSEIYDNNIYVKLESFNPFGSIKDRIAKEIIEKGIKDGVINQDTTIIEVTSGNTGIGLSGVCMYYHLNLIIIMPSDATKERIDLLNAYHAKVILTNAKYGMKASLEMLESLKLKYPNHFIVDQFNNEINSLTHYNFTGKELLCEIPHIDYFVSGIGSGGTITGIGKCLKKHSPETYIIGIKPKEESIKIDGIASDITPTILDYSYIDEIIKVDGNEIKETLNELEFNEALFLGFSSVASFMGIKQLIKKYNLKNKNIVFISADNGTKYLSKLGC